MMAVDTRPLLTPCVFEKWRRFDLWELRQAAFILSGYEPPELADLVPYLADPYALYHHPAGWADYLAGTSDRRATPSFKIAVKELRTLISAMELAASSGALLAEQHFADGGYRTYAKPGAVVHWATAKGYPIPLELESIAEAVAPIPTECTPDPTGPEPAPAPPVPAPGVSREALLKMIGALASWLTEKNPQCQKGRNSINVSGIQKVIEFELNRIGVNPVGTGNSQVSEVFKTDLVKEVLNALKTE